MKKWIVCSLWLSDFKMWPWMFNSVAWHHRDIFFSFHHLKKQGSQIKKAHWFCLFYQIYSFSFVAVMFKREMKKSSIAKVKIKKWVKKEKVSLLLIKPKPICKLTTCLNPTVENLLHRVQLSGFGDMHRLHKWLYQFWLFLWPFARWPDNKGIPA